MKPILILFKAYLRKKLKSKWSILTGISVSIVYAGVFIFEILLYYQINPAAFTGLTLSLFFLCFCSSQLIFFTSSEDNQKTLCKDIISTELDLLLLRPINIFFFKYFRVISLERLIIIFCYLSGFIFCLFYNKVELILVLKLIIFIFLCSVIRTNLNGMFYSFVFYTRNYHVLGRFKYSFENMTFMKPPEVLPQGIRIPLLYLLPYLVIQNFVFDLVRGKDDFVFWTFVITWVGITMFANWSLWKIGFKKYESLG